MSGHVQFIFDQDRLKHLLLSAIENYDGNEILLSGYWDSMIYKKIIEKILQNCSCHNCKIIIPSISKNKPISGVDIDRIIGFGGKINVDSNNNSNFFIIGHDAFILSSSRNTGRRTSKNRFEYCIYARSEEVTGQIKRLFDMMWSRSFPLVADKTREGIT